ncbi:DUF4011 domain-containing protein [bacterium 3DAC]|nr:DUF4011 domain-containing protein [bacterium 3DAC]
MESKEILHTYKKRLYDLSKRNKTLYLNRLTHHYVDLDLWYRYGLKQIIEDHINRNVKDKSKKRIVSIEDFVKWFIDKRFTVEGIFEPPSSEEERIYKDVYNRLVKIYRDARQIYNMRGMYTQYIGWPFIEGLLPDMPIRAPLFLFPMAVDIKKNRIRITFSDDLDTVYLNESLFIALSHYDGIDIPDDAKQEMLSIVSNGRFKLITRLQKIEFILRRYIKDIHYSPNSVMKKFYASFNEDVNYSLKPYAVYGIFRRISGAILKDYERLEQCNSLGLIEDLLGDSVYEVDSNINLDNIHEAKKMFVSEADPSQERVIMSFVESDAKGIVIHGPPGTGKSQTIVNLISQLSSMRKKVLMVCEKKTALDIVAKRLDASGIRNFVLVHDVDKDRDPVLKKMNLLISNTEGGASTRGEKYRAILEKQAESFMQYIQVFNNIHKVLTEKDKITGIPLRMLYSLYLKYEEYENIDDQDLARVLQEYSYDIFVKTVNKLTSLLQYARYDIKPITDRLSWKDLGDEDKVVIESVLNEIDGIFQQKNMEKILLHYPLLKRLYDMLVQEVVTFVVHRDDLQELIKLSNILESVDWQRYTFARDELLELAHFPWEERAYKFQKGKKIKPLIKPLITLFQYAPLVSKGRKLFGTIDDIVMNISGDIELVHRRLQRTTVMLKKEDIDVVEELIDRYEKLFHKLEVEIGSVEVIKWQSIVENSDIVDAYREYVSRGMFSKIWSSLTDKKIKRVKSIVSEIAQSMNVKEHDIVAIADSILQLKHYFFEDIPNELTKDSLREFIQDKKFLLEAWDTYYKLREHIPGLMAISLDDMKRKLHVIYDYAVGLVEIYEVKDIINEYFKDVDFSDNVALDKMAAYRGMEQNVIAFFKLKNITLKDFLLYIESLLLSDLPEVIDKKSWREYIEKKKRQVEFWEDYYRIAPIYGLSETPSNEIDDIFRESGEAIERYSDKYKEYMGYTSALGKYFSRIDFSHKEIKDLQELLAHFDDLRYLDIKLSEMSNSDKLLLEYLKRYEVGSIWKTYISVHIGRIERSKKKFSYLKKIDEYPALRQKALQVLEEKQGMVRQYVGSRLEMFYVEPKLAKKIDREANKKRRKIHLRELMQLYEDNVAVSNILETVPIWLMTPESVSSTFSLIKGIFDVVIYDEASQIPIENAIPSLYRASKMVVAGDEKQLPPSSFFKVSVDDDEDGIDEKSDEIEVKSLLSLAKMKFSTVLLGFHYRSRYEALIAFSNYAFYDGKIAIVPDYTLGNPFEYIKVRGVWVNNNNRAEAEKVVEIVEGIWKTEPTKSIGVITFNKKQADLIYDILESKASRDSYFSGLYEKAQNLVQDGEDMSFFVRNLENVQGDERDIIIFSIGYAPTPDGKMYMRFGPLSQSGGENRLNVAITRAKEKIIVVASIEPEDLRVESVKGRGSKLLKEYLKYVRAYARGNKLEAEEILKGLTSVSEQISVSKVRFDSPFEKEVYDALVKLGYRVDTQVGVSGYRIDLAVKHPTNDYYVVGIECDGELYHSLPSAKERDIFRQRFLETKGWKIIRVWSRHWWRNKEAEISRLKKLVDAEIRKRG